MNLRPLCTAIVCPTISGTTVDRRDQVLMTFLSPPRFITSTFSRRGTSTNGPFFSDLLIEFSQRRIRNPARGMRRCLGFRMPDTASRLFRSPLHDEAVGPLAVACLVALGRDAPRRDRVPSARRLAFAAAQRLG